MPIVEVHPLEISERKGDGNFVVGVREYVCDRVRNVISPVPGMIVDPSHP